jgi:hypothetical protein
MQATPGDSDLTVHECTLGWIGQDRPMVKETVFRSKQDIDPANNLSGSAQEEGMPKLRTVRRDLPKPPRSRSTELSIVVEGQIAELCRDLAVAAKRMRQLQDQADELRIRIRDWVGPCESDRAATVNRGGRR